MPLRTETCLPRPGDLVLCPTGLSAFGRKLPCTRGRGGLVAPEDKREGDGATPAGVHRIVKMLFRPDRMSAPAAWAEPIRIRDLWSDDLRDPAYNGLVRAPHRFGHERLRRADPLYDLVLVVDWNYRAPVPGRGSAIFVHRWRRPGAPTEGCLALAPRDLLWLARRIAFGTRLIIPLSKAVWPA